MSTLFAGPVDGPYRRSITPTKAGTGVDGRSPFDAVMDSVVRLLADPRGRLSSPHTINVLSDRIARAERTVNTVDLKSALIAVWKALLVIVETPAHNQSLLERTPGYEEALTRSDQRFARYMDVLRSAVWNGRMQPVTAPPENASHRRYLSTAGGLGRRRCLSASTFHATNDEAQYFGNTSDHRRRHTSHR